MSAGRFTLTRAAHDVLTERVRQITEEGFDAAHDDEHCDRELSSAAACYAIGMPFVGGQELWPWDASWWRPKDRRADLVRAAALLLAAIERFDRLHPQPAAPFPTAGGAGPSTTA